MKYFKKLVGERIYLSPRNSEDVEQFTEWLNRKKWSKCNIRYGKGILIKSK